MTNFSKPRFTARDIDIVRFVYQCSWLNTTHIIKVMFPPDLSTGRDFQLVSAQAERRLKHLHNAKLLGRVIPLIEPGKGRDPYIYYADRKAYDGIIEGAIVPKISPWDTKYKHDRIVRDIFTDIVIAARLNGVPIVSFKSNKTLKSEYQDYIPDWYFSLSIGDSPIHYFLEFDNGQETRIQWERKIEAIRQYWNSDVYKANYTYRVRIAIVTTSQTRLENLKKWTEGAGSRRRFWFTTLDALTPYTALFSPIWAVATQEDMHYLTEVKQ